MSDTPLLALPYIASSQAQKHVTHNEALSLVDGLLHLSVISRGLAAPPASPIDSDRYLIAAGPTGAWLSHAGHFVLRIEGAWRFFIPRKGWRLWVEDENIFLIYNGAAWISPAVPSALQNLSLLGVNATADATNKLAVSSSSVLFNNVGAGVQFKINKNAVTDTASLLLQTGFSGRAEIGTAGDDNLHFKVSADGSTFSESLIVAAATGVVTAKNSVVLDPQSVDPVTPSNGQLWYNSTIGKFRARQNGSTVDVTSLGVVDGDKGDITVSGTGTVWSIDPNSISNSKLSAMSALTIKGNNSGAAASPIDLTVAQVKSLLAISTGDVSGLGSAALQPSAAFDVAGAAAAITKASLGLGNVDDTSDANKPVSTATATALAGKANTAHTHVAADVTNFSSAVDARVLLANIQGQICASYLRLS